MAKISDTSYDACTIFSRSPDYAGVAKALQGASPFPMKIKGNLDNWKRIEIKGKTSTLTLNSKVRRKPGDDFSGMILGALTYFRGINTDATQQKERILALLRDCNFAVGVVGNPEFDDNDRHSDCIFAICTTLEGMIFTGDGMIDQDGILILDSSGASEL